MDFFRVFLAYVFAKAHAHNRERKKREKYSYIFVRLFCELVFGSRISVLNFRPVIRSEFDQIANAGEVRGKILLNH